MTPSEVEAKLRENAAETAQGWSDKLMLAAADALSAQAVDLERMRGAFRNADPSDWEYVDRILLAAIRHDEDAQTMFWIEALRDARRALSVKAG